MAGESTRRASQWRRWIEEFKLITLVFFAAVPALIIVVGLETGFAPAKPGTLKTIVVIALEVCAAMLFIPALAGLISYLIHIPSILNDAHIFSRVHADNLLHPIATSFLLGLLGLCILTESTPGLILWGVLLATYVLRTAIIARRMRREITKNDADHGEKTGLPVFLMNLIVGGELVTIASGARPVQPWKLSALPENTWIVDVRTKTEFNWNRMRLAESYPWGIGLIEAAKGKPSDVPVLVTCISGHRSPSVAAIVRRLGFQKVYNLSWGLLYLMLVHESSALPAPFRLTRSRSRVARKSEPLKALTHTQLALIFATVAVALLEAFLVPRQFSLFRVVPGAILAGLGLLFIVLSHIALGKNFRLYASPKEDGALVATGIYSLIRHPLYTGVILGLAGLVLIFGSLLAVPFWLGCTICYLVKGVREERLLADKFPEYRAYSKRTRRNIPYIY